MKFIFILIPSLLADICATDLTDAEFKKRVINRCLRKYNIGRSLSGLFCITLIKSCLNDELEALKSNDVHMATELVQTEIKVATLEADNKALKSDIENLNLKNSIAELEIEKLKSQVKDLETANAELTSSINILEGQRSTNKAVELRPSFSRFLFWFGDPRLKVLSIHF